MERSCVGGYRHGCIHKVCNGSREELASCSPGQPTQTHWSPPHAHRRSLSPLSDGKGCVGISKGEHDECVCVCVCMCECVCMCAEGRVPVVM